MSEWQKWVQQQWKHDGRGLQPQWNERTTQVGARGGGSSYTSQEHEQACCQADCALFIFSEKKMLTCQLVVLSRAQRVEQQLSRDDAHDAAVPACGADGAEATWLRRLEACQLGLCAVL